MSTTSACKQVGLRWKLVFGLVRGSPGHSERYTRARATAGAHGRGDPQIADTPVEGVTITTKPGVDGVEEKRADMIEHRRLQIESRKWLLPDHAEEVRRQTAHRAQRVHRPGRPDRWRRWRRLRR